MQIALGWIMETSLEPQLSHQPIYLAPATPSELLDRVLSHHTYPTTLLVCWPKKLFLDGLIQEVRQQISSASSSSGQDGHGHRHPLLQTPLLQAAVSRHLHLAFIPTVAHLRAYLAVFLTRNMTTPPPPADFRPSPPRQVPLLLAYGFVELHRDGSEWSAQGLNMSAAGLVESAARNGLRAAVVEPRKTDGRDEIWTTLDESVPLLSGSTSIRFDKVPVRAVFSRWFEFESPRGVPSE
ncbi:hypothetical protein L249_4433 [Ophiocordyceps polyrhachis-furcata BCC 54312]|uniref:Uncharacterized protein n=1 Tax=Ophiocordyceps polyrhachis-furcata BCC 54312 TaxID=1330021 RepID=A0A367L7I5_9HYPO|nr:hypothetical protein L249_4433 [Ophiocordyceps polyrhachis-furcata BCC 54312]